MFMIFNKILLSFAYHFFFLKDTPPTKIYPLPLHDALPITKKRPRAANRPPRKKPARRREENKNFPKLADGWKKGGEPNPEKKKKHTEHARLYGEVLVLL